MSNYNFSQPSLQSFKGIFVILGINVYQSMRQLFVFISLFVYKYFKDENFTGTTSFIWISIGLVLYLIINAFLSYYNFKFHYTTSHFVLNSGIINKEGTAIPIHKIQNVYIKQNVLQQLLNVVSLAIETAGDDTTEIEIKALTKQKALALKAYIDQYSSITNEFSPQETQLDETILKPKVSKILLEGLMENHFKGFLLITTLVATFYTSLKTLIVSIVEEFSVAISDLSNIKFIILTILIVILVLLLTVALSTLKFFIINFDLSLIKKDNGIEISKGLVNKIAVNLNKSKIQTLTIQTNRIKAHFDIYNLKLTQAMMSKKQQAHLKIIGLDKALLNDIILRFNENFQEIVDLSKPELYFKIRLTVWFIIGLISLNSCLFFIPYQWVFINIPLVIFGFLQIHFLYKKASYHIGETLVYVNSGGILETTKQFVAVNKIQAISLSQTLFQKNKAIASLHLSTASNKLIIKHIKLEDALKIQNQLIYKVELNNLSWM